MSIYTNEQEKYQTVTMASRELKQEEGKEVDQTAILGWVIREGLSEVVIFKMRFE